MNPAEKLLRWFSTDHLTDPELILVVGQFGELAARVAAGPVGAESTTAVRKLIEAKDCACRAVIEGRGPAT